MKKRRKKSRRGLGNICEQVRFADSSSDWQIEIDAYVTGRKVGAIKAMKYYLDSGETLAKVHWVKVQDEAERRCGLGTKLYEKLLNAACQRKWILASDWQRTDASEGFWRKQERKGRAVCIKAEDHGEAGSRLDENFSAVGEWECNHYRMKKACPSSRSLARLPRRAQPKWRRKR